VPGAREGYHSGTSFAAPFVTSVMAVLPKDKLGAPKDEILDALTYADLSEHGRDPAMGEALFWRRRPVPRQTRPLQALHDSRERHLSRYRHPAFIAAVSSFRPRASRSMISSTIVSMAGVPAPPASPGRPMPLDGT
jgi:hypothetical protein